MDGRDNQEGAFRCSTKKFSELMTQALIKNAHKDGWSGCNVRWLVGRLGEEVEELDNALSIRNWQEAIEECADIANFAMMVAERIATIHKEEIDK